MIFEAASRSVIDLHRPGSSRSPLLGSILIRPSIHSLGTSSPFHALVMMISRTRMMGFESKHSLKYSAGILESPHAFPLFCRLTAVSISSVSGASLRAYRIIRCRTLLIASASTVGCALSRLSRCATRTSPLLFAVVALSPVTGSRKSRLKRRRLTSWQSISLAAFQQSPTKAPPFLFTLRILSTFHFLFAACTNRLCCC